MPMGALANARRKRSSASRNAVSWLLPRRSVLEMVSATSTHTGMATVTDDTEPASPFGVVTPGRT